MRRRKFIRSSSVGLVGLAAAPIAGGNLLKTLSTEPEPDAVWVEQGEPAELITAALAVYGGMQRFVSPGDNVLIKPNIGFDRTPAQAATTNPELVGEVVRLALKAGARAMGLDMLPEDDWWLPSLNAVKVPSGIDAKAVTRRLLADHGIEIAGGLGDLSGKIFRIGCMGHACRPRNILLLLSTLGNALRQEGATVDVPAGLAAANEMLNRGS